MKSLRLIAKAERYLSVLLFCTILVTLAWQVFARYILNAPPAWSEELARLLFIYMGVLGVHLAQRDFAHVRIDTILSLIGDKFRIRLEAGILLLCLVTMALVGWHGYFLMIRKAPIELITLGISSGFMFVNTVLLGMMTVGEMLVQLIRLVKGDASWLLTASTEREV